jgi:hypothetical protein
MKSFIYSLIFHQFHLLIIQNHLAYILSSKTNLSSVNLILNNLLHYINKFLIQKWSSPQLLFFLA